MARLRVPVTPSVMEWCRRKAGYSLEVAAQKIGRPVEDIQSWENRSLQPTLAQARKASEVYKRPLAVFLLPEPPKDFSTLRDFRTLPADHPRDFSPELTFVIREAQVRQLWTREFLQEEGGLKPEFVGSASLQSDHREVAKSIRSELSVSEEEQVRCRTRQDALLLWIRRAEAAGVFVFRRRDVPLKEARGFALCDSVAPFVFLNSDDAKAAQLFTLAHELAHLWINETGVSNVEGWPTRRRSPEARVEAFCNRVAAEVLVDSDSFSASWAGLSSGLTIEERIERLSRKYKVSEDVIARKLLDSRRISRGQYSTLRETYQARWQDRESSRRESAKSDERNGPSYYRLKLFRNGHAFTELVLSAYQGGLVSGRETSGLLDIKLNHLAKLAVCAGLPLAPQGT